MKSFTQPAKIAVLTIGLILTSGCRHDHESGGHKHGPSGEHVSASTTPGEPEEEAIARTEFTDKLENFFEYQPLKPGKASNFLIHLTDLRDGKPVANADVVLQLKGPSGQKLESFKAKVGRVTGIYVAEVKAVQGGSYGIDFQIQNDKLTETMSLDGFEVSDSAPQAPATPEAEEPAGTVAFLMEQQWLIDMKLAVVQRKELAQPISSSGRIVPQANSHALVSTPIAGTITGQILPRIGQQITQGQAVAVVAETATAMEIAQLRVAEAQVESAQIQTEAQLRGQNAQLRTQNAQAKIENARLEAEKKTLSGELRLSQARLKQAEKEAERARQVYAVQGISEKELQTVELLAREARTEVQSLQARQLALAKASPLPTSLLLSEKVPSLGTVRSNGAITVSAPFSGLVTSVHKSLGEQVAAGEAILEIANLRTVWLECSVFEKDLGSLSQGMEATFSVLSYPKKQFRGTLINLGSVIDEKTRATSVIFEVPNVDGELKLGMQADVRLTSITSIEATVIPKEAVLDREGKKVVYVLVTGEEFRRRDVTVTEDFGQFVGVTAGLSPGDRVVTQGAYQIFLQETNPADPGVHSHET